MSLAEPPRAPRATARPLSLIRLDNAVARSAAGFGLGFLALSVPPMLDQLSNLRPLWCVLAVGGLTAGLLLALIASIAGKWVRAAHGIATGVYVVALVTWPFAVIDPAHATKDSFFLYYTLTAATVMATIAFGRQGAAISLIAIPAAYAWIRVLPAGGDVEVLKAVLDSVYSFLLGGVISITIFVLRAAARSVDSAQQTALARYSHAVRQHAIEAERVQVDAIVHDSVLTTLLSAARAETPEAKELAAIMAGNAIGHLRDAADVGPDVEGAVSAAVVASRIDDTASTMAGRLELRLDEPGEAVLPIPVAEALYSAAVQALVNSFQHAGPNVDRWVRISPRGAEGIEIEVGDRGRGFDPGAVPDERLGVRVSILDRVGTAGGSAEVVSSPGNGTVVTLCWEPGSGRPADGGNL